MNTQLNDIAITPPLPGNLPDGAKPAQAGGENPAGDAFSTAFARARATQAPRPPGRSSPEVSDPAQATAPPVDAKLSATATGEAADTEAGSGGLTAADPALDLALLQSLRDQIAAPDTEAAAAGLPVTAEAAPTAPPFNIALPVAGWALPGTPLPGANRTGKDVLAGTGPAAPAGGMASPVASRPAPGEVMADLGAGMRSSPLAGANFGSGLPAGVGMMQEHGFEAALAKLEKLESGVSPGTAGTPAVPSLSSLAPNALTAVAPQRAAEPPPVVTATVHAPLPSPAFPDEAAQRLTWLVKNGVESASLRVTPPDMGPIEIRIRLAQDEATIAFAVTQPESGRAIEDALPRLREMLSESGISLGHTSVESGGGGQFAAEEERARLLASQRLRETQTAAPAATGQPVALPVARGTGLVDLFA